MNKIERVKVGIEISSSIVYQACSLHFNLNKQEFYYHFAYSKHADHKLLNFNTGEITGRPDHISFHKDGAVHLRLKEKGHKKAFLLQQSFFDKSFIPKNKKLITPLLFHSIHSQNDKYYLPLLLEDKNAHLVSNKLFWKIGESFSIILFLVHKSQITEVSVLFSYLGKLKGYVQVWDNWCIVYILSTSFLSIPQKYANDNIYNVFAYFDLNKILPPLPARQASPYSPFK